MKLSLATNPKLRESTQLNDPSTICVAIQEALTYQLDQQAPLKKVQVSKNIPIFISQQTKQKIIDRDMALQRAKDDDLPDSCREFLNLRNSCHKMLSQDKKDYINKKLDEKNSEHDRWDTTKEILGWKTKQNPTVLMDRGLTVTSPNQIANALNHSLISKVSTLVRELPHPSVRSHTKVFQTDEVTISENLPSSQLE